MNTLYTDNGFYKAVKKYIKFCFRTYYGTIQINGLQNIPSNKAIIFAPNHVNALMDALAIAYLPPSNLVKVFVARSDIFKTGFNRKALKFLKIIPAYRIRDGYENLYKNQESFETANTVLKNNGSICIMPEGNQGPQYKIRPLVKGIFRIAFSSQLELIDLKEIVIIPVGIVYEDLLDVRKGVIINIGKEIPISDYVDDYQSNPSKTVNEVRFRLKSELENLTINISDKIDFKKYEKIVEVFRTLFSQLKFMDFYEELKKQTYKLNTEISNDDFEDLYLISSKIISLSNKSGIHYNSISIKDILLFAIQIPLLIIGFFTNFFPFILPILLRKRMNIKEKEFWTSVHFVLAAFSFPLVYLIQSVVIMLSFALPLWSIILLFPMQFILGKLTWKEIGRFKTILYQLKNYYIKTKKPLIYNELSIQINQFRKRISGSLSNYKL